MAHARAIGAISRQIDAMRAEEASETAWFTLPEEGDDDVDWMDFSVEIAGPDTYAVAPAGGREGRPSPYTGGIFRLSIKLDDTYPANPPAVKFLTRVWHPNIHLEDGKPCADALREAWKPTWSLRDVLSFMRDLLAAPNGSDCVNSEAGRELLEGVEVFDKHAAEETSKYAKE